MRQGASILSFLTCARAGQSVVSLQSDESPSEPVSRHDWDWDWVPVLAGRLLLEMRS